jgi:hypothetical protein
MSVYEPKRGGNLAERERGNQYGAIVYRYGTPIAEFDYAPEAHAFVERQTDTRGLKILNPAVARQVPNVSHDARL